MEEKKNSKTGAIIGTVAAIALCGLPGLCLLCPGGIAILFGAFDTYEFGYIAPPWGILLLCLSMLFIVIAVVVPVLTLRKKKDAGTLEATPPNEPLPPAA